PMRLGTAAHRYTSATPDSKRCPRNARSPRHRDQPPASHGRSVLGPLRILLRLGVRFGEVLFVFIANHDLDGDALLLELLHVLGVFHRLLENVAQPSHKRRWHVLRTGDTA